VNNEIEQRIQMIKHEMKPSISSRREDVPNHIKQRESKWHTMSRGVRKLLNRTWNTAVHGDYLFDNVEI